MEKLYYGITRILLSIGILLIINTSSWAVSLGFDPMNQTVIEGSQATVDVVVDPMGAFVGAFDVIVGWNDSILDLAGLTVDPINNLGATIDIVDTLGTTDSVNVASVSLEFPLAPFQDGVSDVTLFSLTFDTLTVGTSALTLSPGILGITFPPGGFLGDEFGFLLETQVTNGSIEVVPEPTTWLLLSIGLIGLAGWGSRRFKKD
jgi:hypothetical protein